MSTQKKKMHSLVVDSDFKNGPKHSLSCETGPTGCDGEQTLVVVVVVDEG